VSSRGVWVLLMVAVAAAAIGRWTAPAAQAPKPERARALATGESAATVPAAKAVAHTAPVATDTRENGAVAALPPGLVEAPAADAPALGFDAAAFLAELPQRLDALADRARGGDAQALTEMAEWLDYCGSTGYASNVARYGRPRGDQADAAIAAYFRQTTQLCEQWLGRHAWLSQLREEVAANGLLARQALQARRTDDPAVRAPRTIGEILRLRAAEAGDPVAQGLTNDRGVTAGCGGVPTGQPQPNQQAHWQCVHAAARERLADIFARRDGRVLEAVPRILMALGPRTLTGSEYLRSSNFQSSDLNARWILVGCKFGLDCGPTGRALRWACASEGACGYAHYRDYAADRVLPPAAMRELDRQLPRLVSLILAGDVDSVLGPPPKY